VLALDSEMISALKGPLDATTQDVLNRKLERINGAAQSSTLELLDRTGLAVAASNWRLPSSYVGHNYAFARISARPAARAPGAFMRWA
jgi:two-component system C4-dicarboxylate transport sensor histidine kinase DctB